MRRAAPSLALAALSAIPALADGESSIRVHSGLTLPPPQPSVVVTIERGVRVWRPVTAAYAAIHDPDALEPEAAAPSYPAYGAYGSGSGFGWGFPYGYGYGEGYGAGKKRERLNGLNPSLTPPSAAAGFATVRGPRYPRAAPDRIRIIGSGLPRGTYRPQLNIHVNIGPGPYVGGHRIGVHGGAPARLALGGPRGLAAPSGGHRGGHR